MFRCFKKLLVGGLLLSGSIAFALPGQAGQKPLPVSFLNSGVYFEAVAGYAASTMDPHLNADGLVGGVNIGYQFNSIFSSEVGFLYLPVMEVFTPKVRVGSVDIPSEGIGVYHYALSVAGKVTIPLTNRIGIYGKLGYVNVPEIVLENPTDETGWTLGAGLSFRINAQVTASLGESEIDTDHYHASAALVGLSCLI